MDAVYYCSSEDEGKWLEEDPVINCLSFGWLEGEVVLPTVAFRQTA